MSQVELTISKWDEIWPEARDLFEEHNLEVGLRDPRMPLEVDLDSIAAMERAGILLVVAARDSGILVGYGIWYLVPNLASRNVKMAVQGPWFVLPEWRRNTGTRIWDRSIEELRSRGVKLVHIHHSTLGNGPKLERFFVDSCGATPIEVVYSLWIGDE